MSIGLDLGSTQFRSLRHQGDRLIGRTCRVETLAVPDTPAHRRLLTRDDVPFAECRGTLHIIGDAARDWSRLLSLPTRRLLVDGQLPHEDSIARQILSLMVDAVLPPAPTPDELCSVTIPGELLPTESSPEREFFLRLIRLRGYRPDVVGQGHAVALAEMGNAGYSGLGVSIGAAICEFSLNCSGREVARCAIPWGTDELQDLLPDSDTLESGPEGWTAADQSRVTDFLVELLLEAGTRIEQNHAFRLLTQPAAVVVAGGITGHVAFREIFQTSWKRAAWPLETRSLQLTGSSNYAIARGCLIRAVLESRSDLWTAAA